jgi:hypothetical protein
MTKESYAHLDDEASKTLLLFFFFLTELLLIPYNTSPPKTLLLRSPNLEGKPQCMKICSCTEGTAEISISTSVVEDNNDYSYLWSFSNNNTGKSINVDLVCAGDIWKKSSRFT